MPLDAKPVDAGALVKVVAGAEVVGSAVDSAGVDFAVEDGASDEGAPEVRPPSASFRAAHSSSDMPSAQQTVVSAVSSVQKKPFWHEATTQSVPDLSPKQRFVKR